MHRKIKIVGGAGIAGVVLLCGIVLVLLNGGQAGGGGAPARGAGGSNAFFNQFNMSDLRVPLYEIHRGGPAKDGIPALTDPDVVPVDEVDFLDNDDRVLGVSFEGEARAYPIHLLNWHEAVNDRLGDTYFTAVYCPLCDSASVFDRRIDGETFEFGISGLLYNSNVLLYDRTHDALWSQIAFEAISGPHAGRPLEHLPWELTTFGHWRAEHPGSTVATFDTGHIRNYERNPYEEYFQREGLMFPAKGDDDDRLPEKEPVVGVQADGFARTYPVAQVAAAPDGRVVDETPQGRIVLEASADGGSIRVIEKPEGLHTVHTFWFAWASFHPDTEIFDSER